MNIETLKLRKKNEDQTSVETYTNPIRKTKQNPLQIADSSNNETFIQLVQNPSLELQQQFDEVFFLEQSQAEIKCLRLQQQKGIKAANQILRKK